MNSLETTIFSIDSDNIVGFANDDELQAVRDFLGQDGFYGVRTLMGFRNSSDDNQDKFYSDSLKILKGRKSAKVRIEMNDGIVSVTEI